MTLAHRGVGTQGDFLLIEKSGYFHGDDQYASVMTIFEMSS